LSNKPFLVGQWLSRDIEALNDLGSPARANEALMCPLPSSVRSKFPSFSSIRPAKKHVNLAVSQGFQPARFLTPGWRGESLPSKSSSRCLKLVEALSQDVLRQLSTQDFNRTLKMNIYNEFLTFASTRQIHCLEAEDMTSFWALVRSEATERPENLTRFLSLFASRVAVIALFRLRFMKVLSDEAGLKLTVSCATNPSHWLSQVFKSGTKLELRARATEANLFSWYRPTEEHHALVSQWLQEARDVSIAELIKLTSPKVQDGGAHRIYSHAYSHLNFGLFLNSLMINYPLWVESRDPQSPSKFLTADDLEIISCKYTGDYMESLALSHWLAQHNNKDFKWDQVLCPDFKGREFDSGAFLKMLNELQFMTFLAEIAQTQGQEPRAFIAKVMGGHFQNRKNCGERPSLLGETPFSRSTYDRAVLNLCHLPKNNPYHAMMAQIDDQLGFLKAGGWMFVIAGTSLFAPSQRERLESLLQDAELKAVFDLEAVKGKGEMGQWLYVFRKRGSAPRELREPVSWFRFTADMHSFQDFSDVTEVLRSFYLDHLEEEPVLWQQEWGQGFRLEFFQEAILSGHLIHSASEDHSRVTHPRYFRALLNSSVALGTIFELKSIHPEEWLSSRSALGVSRGGGTILMVSHQSSDETKLSLHPESTLRALYQDHGASLCHYFLVTPKQAGLNPNLLRKYFETQVGRQLIQLTFTGGLTKVKAQLAKLLVPKWFARGDFLPAAQRAALDFLRWPAEQITATDANELSARWNHFSQVSASLMSRYACEVLSALVEFEQTLASLTGQSGLTRLSERLNFENPTLQAALAALRPLPLMRQDNPDVYVAFVDGTEAQDLRSPLKRVELRTYVEGERKSFSLELLTETRSIVQLHSEEELLLFIQFVLQGAKGRPVGQVLKALHVPALAEVRAVIGESLAQQKIFSALQREAHQLLEQNFRTPMGAAEGA